MKKQDEPDWLFKDEQGKEYISSPEQDANRYFLILLLIGMGMPYAIGFALWMAGF